MPEYVNHNGYTVHLTGPDGQIVRVKSRQKITLPDYFDRYRIRGFLKFANEVVERSSNVKRVQASINLSKNAKPRELPIEKPMQNHPKPSALNHIEDRKTRRKEANEVQRSIRRAKQLAEEAKRNAIIVKQIDHKHRQRIVGREMKENPNKILAANLEASNYPISNGIGVGVLSYNRRVSLKRCIDSILAHTDLTRTTLFISDDNSDNSDLLSYLDELSNNKNIVVLRNTKRLGVAGNSNRLLRCLERFNYGLLLNDDVQIMRDGWEHFYPSAMATSGFHHLIFRMPGVYGAKVGEVRDVNGTMLTVVGDKPQGAVLAFSHEMLRRGGYFDESYGFYGMEHVDWSMKAYDFGLQAAGFYDVSGSERFFYLHNDTSMVEDRQALLRDAKQVFDRRKIVRLDPSNDSKVNGVSYIIPFRNTERTDSIKTVVNNIRAQKYPAIDIILVEQDDKSMIDLSRYGPVNYKLVTASKPLFNKSLAFNRAALDVKFDKIVMHDADILAPNFYTDMICKILDAHEACHIGSTVIYADKESTDKINHHGVIDLGTKCERVVGYYEGGSLASTKASYWRCGAFNEDFWGYGCEDCDFYARLSSTAEWYEQRTVDFLHLHHGRVPGWDAHHKVNKEIEKHLRAMPMADRVKNQYDQCIRNGYGEMIDKALSGVL